MKAEDIILERSIIHILDSTMGMPVLSGGELECHGDLSDFFKMHIEKVTESDEVKNCVFYEDAPLKAALYSGEELDFVLFSQQVADAFYKVMNENIDIPAGDLAVLLFRHGGMEYLGFLKMNYKSSYTHMTGAGEGGNINDIILQKALLPTGSQRLTEAAVLNLETGEIKLIERRYDVNGKKTNYLSKLVLMCQAPISQKERLDIVTKAVDQVTRKHYGDDDVDKKMEIKSIIYQELEAQGGLQVEAVKEKVFRDNEEMKKEFDEKIEKYNISQTDEVKPQNPQTTKKFERQKLMTDTGIEISIPMEQYQDGEVLEFVTNPDGRITVMIKNIGKITSK